MQAAFSLPSVISGSGSLQIAAELTLTGANTYTGSTALNGPATDLTLAHTTNGTIDAAGTGTLSLNRALIELATGGTLANVIAASGQSPTVISESSVTLTGAITGRSTNLRGFDAQAGTLTFAHGGNTYSGIVELTGAVSGNALSYVASVANVFDANDVLQDGGLAKLTLEADQTLGGLRGELNIAGAPATSVHSVPQGVRLMGRASGAGAWARALTGRV